MVTNQFTVSFPLRVVTPAQAGAGIEDVIPVKTGIQGFDFRLMTTLRGHAGRDTALVSFSRTRESSAFHCFWMTAFAGMTAACFFTSP